MLQNERMQRRPLVWYRSGMISLLLLPTLCLFFLREKGVFQEYRLLPVFQITKEFYEPQKYKWVNFVRPPERQDLEILVNGDEEQSKTNLEMAQHFLNQLVNRQDTVSGVHFKFGDRAKYWMFVLALDICKIEKTQHFVTLENDIRAYYEEPDFGKTLKPVLLCEVIAENTDFEQNAFTDLREFWQLGLVFSLLVVFSFLSLYKVYNQ